MHEIPKFYGKFSGLADDSTAKERMQKYRNKRKSEESDDEKKGLDRQPDWWFFWRPDVYVMWNEMI